MPTESLADDRLARSLRRFGPLGILASLIILFAGPNWFRGILVLVWAKLSHIAWRDLGYARPKNWIAPVIGGIAFGTALKFLLKAVVMPLFGADPINRAYHYLAGNTAALPLILFTVTIGAGFGEETVFRGFLFNRLRTLLGAGRTAAAITVLLSSAIFASAHYFEQGLAGVEQASITGLIFGTIYARARKLWFVIFAHAAFDVVAVAIIYCGLEEKIAHLVFK